MNIDILTLLSNFWLNCLKNHPNIKKAILKKIIKINLFNIKKYGIKKGKKYKIDDYQYGGGYGMIIKIEPIYNYIKYLKKKYKYDYIIYLTPDAKLYNQYEAIKLSKKKHILFISGYYKGIDQRIRDYIVNKEYSIGNYILSNGDLSTLIVIDSIIRLLPGVLGNIKSTYTDTSEKKYEYPLYTRPYNYKNMRVPKILLSGNHKKIKSWREKKINLKYKKINKGTK